MSEDVVMWVIGGVFAIACIVIGWLHVRLTKAEENAVKTAIEVVRIAVVAKTNDEEIDILRPVVHKHSSSIEGMEKLSDVWTNDIKSIKRELESIRDKSEAFQKEFNTSITLVTKSITKLSEKVVHISAKYQD